MRRFTAAAALAALALVFVHAAAAWTWPAAGDVVQQYTFDPADPYAAGQHRGIDIAGDADSTVVAPASGAITFAGTVPTSGRSVTITTADGYAVTLTHLGNLLVAKGATVAEGDAVGTIGPSGDAEVAVPYVHLGIRLAADEQGYVDPLGLLPPRPAPSPEVAAPPAVVTTAAPATPAAAPQPAQNAVASPPATATAALTGGQAAAAPADAPVAVEAPAPATTPQPPAAPAPAPAVRRAAARPRPAAAPAHESAKPHAADQPQRPVHVAAPSTGRLAAVATAVVHPTHSARRIVEAAPAVRATAPGRTVHRAPRPSHVPAHPKRRGVRAERFVRRALHPVAVAPLAADARRASQPAPRRSVRVAVPHHAAFVPPAFAAAAALALALLVATLALLRAHRGARTPVRMIAANVDSPEEGLGGSGVAVRLGSSSPWTRSGLRGSVGRVCALPPAQGRRRSHGQRYGRARHAGDGRRGSRGEVLR